MCGPVATMYADRLGSESVSIGRVAHQQLLFNAGRTVSYATLGAAFGLLGTVFYETAAISRYGTLVRAVVGVAVGAFIIGVGAFRLAGRHRTPLDALQTTGRAGRVLGRLFRGLVARLDGWVEPPRVVVLGLAHGVMPCPLLFPAFLYAFARSDPVVGGVSLAVLGLATTPTMLAYGTATGTLSTRSRGALHRALGAAFLLLGYVPFAHGLAMLGVPIPHITIPVYQPLVVG
ncbi:sulfite exporter TauE/SafE family protein (plasmid) [Halarchaeum sp. CBA1220]|nr:sulfite exporter TauE/SafE family protein [Halarchaeum sp. CBA1220]